jgi:hypothetical protein
MKMQTSERITLVGPSPGLDSDPREPLSPGKNSRGTGWCLVRLTGLDPETYLMAFNRKNLLPHHQGRNSKGDRLPLRWARREALRMSKELRGGIVVLIGRNVAKAFNIDHTPPFEWIWMAGTKMAWIPSPSGANRWWNNLENKKTGEAFISALGQKAFDFTLQESAA